ncbi:MAG: preprotein translocase subunit YajC [Firmicutes bacterium]|nr:preprotein translocase subunit YajC [Bacillota bacterium]
MEPTTWIVIGLLVLLVGVIVVLPIFTNKKRRQQVENLHSSLRVGDKIMTVGGIIGTILKINKISPVDTEILIETGEGDNKTPLLIDVKALYQVLRTEAPVVSMEEQTEAAATATEPSPDIFDIPSGEEVITEPKAEEAATEFEPSEEETEESIVRKSTYKPRKK